VKFAAIDRSLAEEAARVLGQVGARGPADIAALGTLVQGGTTPVDAHGPAVPAAQTLDLTKAHLHVEEESASQDAG